MTDAGLKEIEGKPGDPWFELLFAMMEAMREATTPILDQAFDDPRDALSVLMSSAATFAGVQAGTLMATGALRQQDKKRVCEAALKNFRQGIDFGLNRGLRIGTEQHGGAA
jgi:hypothetical protein